MEKLIASLLTIFVPITIGACVYRATSWIGGRLKKGR